MPIFEFVCEKCGESFEELLRTPYGALRNAEATDQLACPHCGGSQIKKKISSFASRITGGNSLSSVSQAACSPAST